MTKRYVKAMIPIDITDAMLVSSSIVEPSASEPAWVAGTYAEFARVSVIDTNSHLVYESLVGGNTDNPSTLPRTKWILKSYTNRWRMFEWNRGLPSEGGSPSTAVIRPGKCINSIVLLGLKAATVELTVQNGIGGDVVFQVSKNLLARYAVTPYEIIFTPFIYDKVFATFDVPPVGDPVITLRLTHPGGVCEVERFAIGMAIDLGEVEWNTALEDENYSPITYEAGRANFEPVPNMPGLELPIVIDSKRINRALQFKELGNGKAIVWSAMPSITAYEQMHTMIGPYQRFKVSTDNHRQSSLSVKIRGI